MGNPYAPKPPGAPVPPRDQERRPAAGPPPRAERDTHLTVDPDAMRTISRRLTLFMLLLLVCLLLTSAPLPWRMGSIAFAVAALAVGTATLRRAWRAKVRGVVVAALAAGMAVSVTLALATVAVVPVWDIEMDRQTCMSEAITHTARSACLTSYGDGLQEYQDSLTD